MAVGMFRICLLSALAGGCASSPSSEALISGNVQGEFNGVAFVARYGFAEINNGAGRIGLSEAPIGCGSWGQPNPSGSGVIITVPLLAAGSYPSASVEVFRNVGIFQAASSTADVELAGATSYTVAGSLSFMFTDTARGMFSATGDFEVVNCQ